MVFSWYNKQIVKKKYPGIVTATDKKNWIAFTKRTKPIYDKDNSELLDKKTQTHEVRKLDLHGFSLNEANKVVRKFINEAFKKGCKQLLIITGKGLRSKSYDNPYQSNEMNVLKNSVPEFIMNDEDLYNKITKISNASIKDGGEGAFYIFLKQ